MSTWRALFPCVRVLFTSLLAWGLLSFLFTPLVTPFAWLAQAWQAEGTILVIAGIISSQKRVSFFGWLSVGMGLFCFLLSDWLRDFRFAEAGFVVKYTLVTFLNVLLAVLLQRERLKDGQQDRLLVSFTVFVMVNVWFYLLHMANEAALVWLPRNLYFEACKAGMWTVIHLTASFYSVRFALSLGNFAGYLSGLMLACGLFLVAWLDISQPFVRQFSALQFLDFVVWAFLALVHGLLLITGIHWYRWVKKDHKKNGTECH